MSIHPASACELTWLIVLEASSSPSQLSPEVSLLIWVFTMLVTLAFHLSPFIHTGQIDVGRYLLDVKSGLSNPKKQVNRVIAMGQQAVYGELAKYGDCDNGWGLVEFANGKVLTTHLGRTLTNGFEGMTRVCGTKGHAVVNGNSVVNRVEVRDSHGVRTNTTPDAFVLYDKSFTNDLAEFASAVLENEPLTCYPEDAYEAAKIATALQYSFRNGVPVYFDDNGLPIMETAR